MKLPEKGDLFIWDEFSWDRMLKQGEPMLILGVDPPYSIKQSAALEVVSVRDPDINRRIYWGHAGGLVNYPNGHEYHLVKVGKTSWTRQVKEGKCPIIEQIAEVK